MSMQADSGWGNPIVGGTVLRIPAVQSPGFVTGSVGWSINSDGTVEFNSGTFRGTVSAATIIGSLIETSATAPQIQIDSTRNAIFVYDASTALIASLASTAGTDFFGHPYPAGLMVTTGTISGTTFQGTDFIINASGSFFYSSTPAAGNLISSQTVAAGTDAHGNAYLAGHTEYQTGAGPLFATNINNGQIAWFQASTQAGPWTQVAALNVAVTGVLPALVALTSAALSLGNLSSTPPSNPIGAVIYAGSTGAPQCLEPSGNNRVLDRSQASNSSITLGNTATETAITNAWTIDGNDMTNTSVYEIETSGDCVFEGQTLTFGISRDGAAAGARETIGGAFVASGTQVNWWMKARIVCTATGVSGSTTVQLSGGLAVQGANLLAGASANTISCVGPPITATVDTTASHTFAITAKWGATATGLTLTAHGSTHTKKSS